MKKLVYLLLLCSFNLAAQSIEDGLFAVITFERKIANNTETYFWIVPKDSISVNDNGRFCLYPLYLASEQEKTWTPLCNGNGDPDYCITDPFCILVKDHQEMVQKIQSKRRSVIYKTRPKEITVKETVKVYITFVSGSFMVGVLQTNNVINKGIALKAYTPLDGLEIVKMGQDDRIYELVRMTDYQGVAFSITKLPSYPFDREASKAYQAAYQ